jgi:hypothetical protein
MNNKIKVPLMLIGFGIVMGIIGFIIGRNTVDSTSIRTIDYVSLPAIHDSIPRPVPYKVEVPSDPEYIYKYKTDTITVDSIRTVKVIDTSAVLKDWSLKRSYKNTLFDNDSIGKLQVTSEVQYNQLRNLKYTYYPIMKVETNRIISKNKLELLGGAGLSPNGAFNLQFGIFTKKHLGFSYQYMRDVNNNKNYHGFNVLIKY